MQVQVVGDAVRHPGGAEVEAVQLGEVDELVGVLRDAGADEGVVRLPVRAGRPAVDEGGVAGDPVRSADRAALDLAGFDGTSDLVLPCLALFLGGSVDVGGAIPASSPRLLLIWARSAISS